ncbi:hypothetical protein [Novosphingobium sp. 9]|uniref:hypothetical protein n=1 Tax=Novosphingobium sp. 9 TaxID=2025349 RepID=UPI0021B5F113|nr:hypothetical protein [Novosphingobium sp. 9]
MHANSPEMRHLSYEGGLSFAMGLRQLRIIPSERTRFERIFQSAIDPRDGSYQLGYLFVCAIETLSQSHGRSDMLLGFLRNYFFNDPVLAALILDEDTGIVELYNQVSVYFSERVVALTSDPETTARQVEAWGTTVPFAPVARSRADDFLGRTPSDEADPAAELYAEKLRAFCTSVGSEVVPGEVLETFLVLGRALMPLGSDDFAVTAVSDGLVHMSTDKGLEISVNTADFHSTPCQERAFALKCWPTSCPRAQSCHFNGASNSRLSLPDTIPSRNRSSKLPIITRSRSGKLSKSDKRL